MSSDLISPCNRQAHWKKKSEIQVCSVIWLRSWAGENSSFVEGTQSTNNNNNNNSHIAFRYGSTDVDDKQQLGYTGMSTTKDKACHAHTITREDRRSTLTNFAQELDTLLSNASNIVHDQLDYRKMCAGCVSKNLADDLEACCMGRHLMDLTHCHSWRAVFAVPWYRRCNTCCWRDTQNQCSIRDVETTIISHTKGIQNNAISEDVRATVFCKHKDVLLVALLVWHCNFWALLWYSGRPFVVNTCIAAPQLHTANWICVSLHCCNWGGNIPTSLQPRSARWFPSFTIS